MNHARRIAAILTGLVAVLVALAAAPAFATLSPRSPKHPPIPHGRPAGTVSQVHSVIVGGMPGWQITLIAAAAALLAATVAVLLDHRGRGTSARAVRGAQRVSPARAAGPAAPLPADTAGQHPRNLVTGTRHG